MIPKENGSTTKPTAKKTRSVKKKLKSAQKKAETVPVVIKSSPHSAWKRLHPIGASLQEGYALINSKDHHWELDHLKAAFGCLLNRHKQGNLFVILGNQPISETLVTPVLHVILAPAGIQFLLPFLRRKAHQGLPPQIVDFRDLSYVWKPMDDLVPGLDEMQGRIFGLCCDCTRDHLEDLSPEDKAMYEYANLMDCRPSKSFPRNSKGKLDVEHVCFDLELPNGTLVDNITFDRDVDQRKIFIPTFCEEHGLDPDEDYDLVNQAIVQAFEKKRAFLEVEHNRVLGNVPNVEVLEQVYCAKIYPSGMKDRNACVVATDHEYGPAEPDLLF